MGIDKKTIGLRIQETRKQKNLTQKELGEQVGLTDQYLSRVERGATAVTLKTISDIADCLGVDVCEFMRGSNTESPEYTKYEVFKIMEKATPRQRKQILQIAKVIVSK